MNLMIYLLLEICLIVQIASLNCSYENQVPKPGNCLGPLERLIEKRRFLYKSNFGCSNVSQLEIYI